MIAIATPISTLFSNKDNINKIIKYSDCLEGRENLITIKNNKIKLIHFDVDLHKKFTIKNKIEIQTIIGNKILELITFQISSDYYKPRLIDNKFYPFGKKILKKYIHNNIKYNLAWLKKKINYNCKIGIENNNYYPTGAYSLTTNSKFLNEIVKKFNLLFLFDYSHAKITAFNLNITFNKYISQLPIDRVVQMHFCGYGIINQEAIDTHILPSKNDFKELKRLLMIFKQLSYITLEYYKDIDNLIKTLKQIRKKIT